MTRRVLFVAYNFPPVGGAGVQRTTKFVKYLPQFGWSASVLTVANPSVPVCDESLSRDIPEGTVVCRARTFEPAYSLKVATPHDPNTNGARRSMRLLAKGAARKLAKWALQPDAQILWLPDAVRRGEQLLRSVPHDVILVTAPPFSSFFAGAVLSRRTGIPLVLDYRDEWSISNAYWENKRLGPFSRRLQDFMQRSVMRDAKAILATTRASARALELKIVESRSAAKVSWIYNGYDADDFRSPAPLPAGEGDFYRVAYVGTLWALTDVLPLVRAIRRLADVHPALASRLELILAGRRTPEQQAHLAELKDLPCRVSEHSYVNHTSALEIVRSSDCLCLLLSDLPHADRVVPGKLFECLAARKPILAIAPRGELWDLLESHPCACLAEPRSVPEIAQWLAERIRAHSSNRLREGHGFDQFDRFERRNQARELARLLESLN